MKRPIFLTPEYIEECRQWLTDSEDFDGHCTTEEAIDWLFDESTNLVIHSDTVTSAALAREISEAIQLFNSRRFPLVAGSENYYLTPDSN